MLAFGRYGAVSPIWRGFVDNKFPFQLAIGVPFLGLFLYLFKLPESVRWAWAMGKFDTANKVIEKMADFNKVEVPKEFLVDEIPELGKASVTEVGMGPLLGTKALRSRLIVMAFNWIVATLCFYGLSLNAGIGSNVFSAFSLSAAMEIPAYCFSAMVSIRLQEDFHLGAD